MDNKSLTKKPQNRRRQRELSNNHSTFTAFIMGMLSQYVGIKISYPNKLSSITMIFPKLKYIIFEDKEPIDIYSIISQRMEKKRQEKEEKRKGNRSKPRMNFERRYDIYHYVIDLLEMYIPIEITNVIEENGGISGEYEIKMNGKRYDKNEIKERGEEILKRVYRAEKGGRSRVRIKWKMINDLYL